MYQQQFTSEKQNHENILELLKFIPANEYQVWLQVLMGIKSELGEDGYAIADMWSQSSDSYDNRSFQTTWKSLKDGAITIGTLIYLAKQNGYTRLNHTQTSLSVPLKKTSPVKNLTNTQPFALKLWLACSKSDSVVSQHQYAIDKSIEWEGGAGRGIVPSGIIVGKNSDCIIIPIRNIKTGKVQGVQCINAIHDKQTFGLVTGGALILGNTLNKNQIWYVAEGWASAFSMVFHHQNGDGVCVCSFGKTNQLKTAELIDEIYQPKEVNILREQD